MNSKDEPLPRTSRDRDGPFQTWDSIGGDMVQEGSGGQVAGESIRWHRCVLSSGMITPCLGNAWTSAVISGRISLSGF